MRTEIIPLGTSSALPTRDRHLSALALVHAGRLLLFDCGEGTQLRLLDAGLSHARLDAIFVTHLHGDHFFGLPGLLTTMTLLDRTEPLVCVGPSGLAEALHALPGTAPDHLSFRVVCREARTDAPSGVVYEARGFTVESQPIEHRIPVVGYRYAEREQPGRLDAERAQALGVTPGPDFGRLKNGEPVESADGRVVTPADVLGPTRRGGVFAYVTDTRPCAGGRALARDADLVYHDATFTDEAHGRAVRTGHATAREAAEVARDAGAHRLLLGHFSARYPNPAPLVAEAQATFQNTEAAEELKRYRLRDA